MRSEAFLKKEGGGDELEKIKALDANRRQDGLKELRFPKHCGAVLPCRMGPHKLGWSEIKGRSLKRKESGNSREEKAYESERIMRIGKYNGVCLN